jgi:hypothetical protein
MWLPPGGCGWHGNEKCTIPREEAFNSINALHLTAIPLRSIAAGELGRSAVKISTSFFG